MTEEAEQTQRYPADELHHDDCEYKYQALLETVAFSNLSLEQLRQAALEELQAQK